MKKGQKTLFLIITFGLIFLLPLLGSLTRWQGLPAGYGEFPAQKVEGDPGFNLLYFSLACVVAVAITAVLAFPRMFGFKKGPQPEAQRQTSSASFPVWFWWSLPVLAVSWFLMWARIDWFEPVENYTFVPLWWSFILILDGLVYKRNNGVSIISRKPQLMQLLAVVSCFSWFAFEYLNFFVIENWYYPNKDVFSNFGNVFWFSLSYTTVLPAIVEWYLLLKTFTVMRERYKYGPKFNVSRTFLIIYYILGLILAFGMGYYPYLLFWVLWVALVPMLSAAMALVGYWTPFTPVKNGDWSKVILIALATVLNGFFWEFWNFGSEWFHDSIPTNPNYWKYSVPYLDKIHIFSEMPILGYYGYLFFGLNCWIMWLIAAYVFKFDADFEIKGDKR
ncbi:small-conductance mechanosensitive channel [Paenibacillus sp. PK3_47]|uniref:small-conductance mechanosensitive channel n=1 Tax=Paenibacillus sp. PK3_47 TaxID=2072642 RepID=UPI00201D4A94|nr:small-conductance mechanosensitive channel [Paenibacillus sp. PK3_47]UQZ32293.1 small-conductance mechanosensitive channel [Paenibacillus sp. PK3_47]